MPAAAWGAWVEFAGWICPLTPLENWLRVQGGTATYTTGFVERYLLPLGLFVGGLIFGGLGAGLRFAGRAGR